MACNSYDTQIAIVENQGTYDNIDDSAVRIYDVGRSRTEDETVRYYYISSYKILIISVFRLKTMKMKMLIVKVQDQMTKICPVCTICFYLVIFITN